MQASHSFAIAKEALDAFHHPESGITVRRDYRRNDKDLAWMRSRLDKCTWNLHLNATQCVRFLVVKEHRSVVLYQAEQVALSQAFMVSLNDRMTNIHDYNANGGQTSIFKR
jgi:hypothetical protein